MKTILELTRVIADINYHKQQFQTQGNEKNILFINPQLSGRHLYTMLLPSQIMRSPDVATAITTISKYDPIGQLLGGKEVELTDEMIDWAEYLVFPFTTQPLVSEIYTRIRDRNPDAKIVYSIDFNFYELSAKHPYKYIFNENTVMNDVEDNIFFADIALVSNTELQKYIVNKCRELIKNKYKGVSTRLSIGYFPYMIDTKIMFENVDYEIQDLLTVKHIPTIEKELKKISEVAKAIKKKDIKKNDKKIPLISKPKKIIKSALKEIKTNGNKKAVTVDKPSKPKSETVNQSTKPKSSRKRNKKG